MNKKGFTLVELLAVIVILAVLILIALPNVMNIMEKARKDAFKDEALEFIKAAETQYAAEGGTGCKVYEYPAPEDPEDYEDDINYLTSMKDKFYYFAYIKVKEGEDTLIIISNGRYRYYPSKKAEITNFTAEKISSGATDSKKSRYTVNNNSNYLVC